VREHHYLVYILASGRNGTLYVGVTNDLGRRTREHRDGEGVGFTRKYSVHTLVWYERFQYVQNAIHREKQLKRWRRARKIALIEAENPQWLDLLPHDPTPLLSSRAKRSEDPGPRRPD
jgi:putative endonuclease